MTSLVDKIRKVIATRAEELHTRHAILFGSQATGDATPESDIDIGVYLDREFFDSKRVLRHQIEIGAKLQMEIDDGEVDVVIPVSYTHLTLPTKA